MYHDTSLRDLATLRSLSSASWALAMRVSPADAVDREVVTMYFVGGIGAVVSLQAIVISVIEMRAARTASLPPIEQSVLTKASRFVWLAEMSICLRNRRRRMLER